MQLEINKILNNTKIENSMKAKPNTQDMTIERKYPAYLYLYLALIRKGAIVALHVGCAQWGLEGGVVGVGRQWTSAFSSSSSAAGSRLWPVALRDDRAEVGQSLLQLTNAVRIVASRPILALAELTKIIRVKKDWEYQRYP